MSVETEIERMVVRLVADASQYVQGLESAIDATVRAEVVSKALDVARLKLQETNRQAAQVERQAAQAQAEANRITQQGIEVTNQFRTAAERQGDELRKLDGLYKAGAISAQTYVKALQDNQKQLETVRAAEAANRTNRIGEIGGGLVGAGAAVGLLGGGVALGGLMSAARYEDTNVAFTTMIGSALEAKRTLADLTRFAAETPFEMPEIEVAARGLIQFGERGTDMMKTLKALGDAASATNTSFGMVALIFNQIRGVGHLLTQDFRQLSSRGILSLQDLANHFKVPVGEAQKMLSSGKITFEDVRSIFENLSKEGGRFANMMQERSKTLTGLWSTLRDQTGLTLRAVMEPMIPYAKDALSLLIRLGKWFYDAPQWIKTTVGAIASFSTGIGAVLTTTGGLLMVVNQAVNAYRALRLALFGAAVAQAAMNAAQSRGAVVTGVAAGSEFMKGAASSGTAAAASGMGRLGTAGLIIGAGAAASVGANMLGSYLFGLDDVQASVDKGHSADAEMRSRSLTRLDKAFDQGSDSSVRDQLANQRTATAQYDREYEGVRNQVRLLKEETKEYGWWSRNVLDSTAYEDLQKQIKAAEDQAAEMNEKLIKQKQHLTDLEYLAKVPAGERERSAEFDKQLEKLKERANLSQLSPDARLEYEANKAGANQQQVDEYVNLHKSMQGDELRRNIKEMNDQFAIQGHTVGMTADELLIYKLRIQDADNAAVDLSSDIDALEASMAAARDAEKAQQNWEAGKKMLEDAKDRLEAAQIGKQAQQIGKAVEEGKLTQDEADQYARTIEQAKVAEAADRLWQDAKDGLREAQYKLNEELRIEDQIKKAGLSGADAEAYRATIEQTKALQDEFKMMEEAKRIHEKYGSVTERLAEKKADLKNLFDSQLISSKEYTEALKDLDKEFSKDHRAVFKAEGLQAVAAGSADALGRLMEFRAGTAMPLKAKVDSDAIQAKINPEATKQTDKLKSIDERMKQAVETLNRMAENNLHLFNEANLG